MIKIDNIYPKIVSKENLYHAAYMAARSRRFNDSVAEFNFHLEEEIDKLHRDLAEKTYRHGDYRVFTVYEPKERRISAAPFRDRIVHHAVHDVIEPLIDKTFIYDSYACRKNKGTHKALTRAQASLRFNAFCLHGDIKKYFQSIGHAILKEIIRKKIEDKDLLWLLDEIIDSALSLRGTQCRSNPCDRDCFVAENAPRNDSKVGLPIGNLTSQFFANLYLDELDYFVKFDLKLKFYIRYMDDFLLFENDRDRLVELKAKIRDFLQLKLALELHEGKTQIYNTASGMKFLGFRIFKTHRRLTTDNVRRFKKRLKNFRYLLDNGKIGVGKVRDSIRCWVAHSNYANTNGLRLNIFDELTKRDERFAGLLKDVLLPQDEIRNGKNAGGGA